MTGERNDDLAYQVLDHIRDDPKSWNQAHYFCGTQACFAGWALHLNAVNCNRTLSPLELADPGGFAASMLGWSWADAETVFSGTITEFSDLERRVKNVLNGEVEKDDRPLRWTA